MTKPPDKQASDGRPDRGALSYKSFDVEIKAADESTGSFELYCAVFGNVDRQGELIQPGAFANLSAFVKDGWGAVNHVNNALPVAMVDTATQDGNGLKIAGVFHSTLDAQACRTVVVERKARGKSVKCSFGYRVIEGGFETRGGKQIYVITKLEIYEFSFVNLPANVRAEVTSVKSISDLVGLDQIEGFIQQTKAGRVISSSNHTKLKEFAKGLDAHGKAACTMAKGLKDWLAQHGPVDDEDEEEEPDAEPDDEGKKPKKSHAGDARLQALRLRAARGRVTTPCP